MNNNYTIIHLHSDLSNGTTNIDSITKFHDYINKAKELGMKSIAFTEHGNVFQWKNKKEYCEKMGLKYIHAVECYITANTSEKIRDNYHTCLYALNFEGFKELNKIISKANNRKNCIVVGSEEQYYYVPRITIEDFLSISNNIAVSSACLGGVLYKCDNNDIKEKYLDYFIKNKHRCFLEIQHHFAKEQIDYNKYLYELHLKYDIPLIVGTDTHALNSEHLEGRIILQKSKNIHFENEEGWDLSFKTYDELINLYINQKSIPMKSVYEALKNTNKLSDMVEEFTIDKSYKYPKLYNDSEKVFKDKIREGVMKRKIDKKNNFEEYKQRINYEYKTIKSNGSIDFFLLEEDLKSMCRKNDIQYGYSRGSVSGSQIAYALYITEVDSIKHKMNFERFMNLERVSLADIDTDFSPNDRKMVKDYLFNKKGLYCSEIITFNTIALKGAIRDVGRALEIPLKEVNNICSNIESDEQLYRQDKKYTKLFEYVDMLQGVIVSVGSHPCFLQDQLIMTDSGYKKIKDIQIGENVLTHTNTFKKVVDVMMNNSNDIYEVKSTGSLPIKVTKNHPFYVRERKNVRLRKYKDGIDTTIKIFEKPVWKEVSDLKKGDMLGIAINQNSKLPENKFDLPYENKDFWWIIGRYLGDGWYEDVKNRTEKRCIICCNKTSDNELNDIVKRIEGLFDYRYVEERTTYKIFIKNNDLFQFVKQFGKYAYGKRLTNDIFDLPNNLIKEFIDGYLSADGHYIKKEDRYGFTTISKELALGISSCINKVYKRHCHFVINDEKEEFIEGRKVLSKKKYRVSFTKDIREKERCFYEDGYIWIPFKEKNKLDIMEKTYNLSVLDDNSYTVNNVIVHNCGFIVSPIPLDENIGLFTTSTSEYPISQINMKEVDSLNFVKLDILGLDNVQVINDVCKLANIERLTPDNINENDENVWNSILEDNLGVFQWESSFAHEYYKKLFSKETIAKIKSKNPNFSYMDLFSIGNGAIRPAGESYREALANGEYRDNGHKALNDFLAPTLGYLVYQEQIIEFLHSFCGFTMGEADIVRRGFAKKTGTEQYMPKIKEGFYKTMLEKYNTSKEESEKIIASFIKIIEDASDYLFSENHAKPYSYIGYACAWLRYYYPLEFLTVCSNIWSNDEEKTNRISNYANKIKIKIISPKFRYSKGGYFYNKELNSLYKGIGSIKFLNSKVADELYELRNNQYLDFYQLLKDVKTKTSCNSRQLDILIKCGYFEEFGGISKILKFIEYFDILYNKKAPKKSTIKEKILDNNIVNIIQINSVPTDTTYAKFSYDNALQQIWDSMRNDDATLREKITFQKDLLGFLDYKNNKLDKRYVLVSEINTKYTPTLTTYCLNNGADCKCKISKRLWNTHPLQENQIIYIHSMERKFGHKKVGETVDKKGNTKPVFEVDESKIEWWITNYSVIDDDIEEALK